jgi:hypothetical protein
MSSLEYTVRLSQAKKLLSDDTLNLLFHQHWRPPSSYLPQVSSPILCVCVCVCVYTFTVRSKWVYKIQTQLELKITNQSKKTKCK